MKYALFVAAGVAVAVTGASAQVVINEVYENPPGGGSTNDAFAEYIELYGAPNMDLTGYCIALYKGGEDDGDNVPEVPAEIDEAFSLDGLSLGSNGILIIYNGTPATSFIPLFLPNAGENSSDFFATNIPSTDPDGNGNLNNDGSSTYLLIRKRPHHSIVNGVSVYAPGYACRKDVDPDTDYDGHLDFGFEIPTSGTMDPTSVSDPIQIIDELAWSNAGGKEYVRSSEQEISDTAGFNPDAVSRLAYYGANPMLGLRLNSDNEVVPTRTADEEFIYGDMVGSSVDFTYDIARYGAPTDQGGDGYQDISIGTAQDPFRITPGGFNDHAGTGISQFRFVAGDLNFDGVADAADVALLDAQLLGADFDATEDYIDPDTEMPIPDVNNPGQNYQSYVFQGRLANAFLAARELDQTDGPNGTNDETVTLDDRAALLAITGPVPCSPADLAAPFGTLNIFDIQAYIGLYNAHSPSADLAAPIGTFNIFDIQAYIGGYNQGCP